MISPKQILALEALNEENSHFTFQSKLSEYQKPKQSGGVISFDGFKAPHFKDSGAPATDGSDDIFDAQIAGKQGFLYRQTEEQILKHFPHLSTFNKMWVTVMGQKLLYGPCLQSPMVCKGYLELDSETDVKMIVSSKESFDFDETKHSFVVKHKDTSLIFAAESNDDREEWLSVIRQACSGICHYLPRPKLIFPSTRTPQIVSATNKTALHGIAGISNGLSGSAAPSATIAEIDYPHKEGFLKKTSSGNSTLGIMKSIKNRWFRLEGGELRYYESMDARPTTLKGTVDLLGATVSNIDSSNCISLQLSADGQGAGRLMRLEAPTPKAALEWHNALAETCILRKKAAAALSSNPTNSQLALSSSSASAIVKAVEAVVAVKRRQNIHDSLTFEEELVLTGSTANSGTAATRRSSLFSFYKSSTNNGSEVTSGLEIKKSDRTVDMIVQSLKQHFLLKTIRDIHAIVQRMQPLVVAPGEVIIWQGTTGNYFYFLESGQCDVIKDGVRISYVFSGKSFGELALLNSATRQATIRASQVCRLWLLDRKDFRFVLAEQEKAFLEEKVQFLRRIELFKKLLPSTIEKIAHVMELKSYRLGDKLVKQGDAGDAFYMIQTGRVAITQIQSTLPGFSGSSPARELARLSPGQSFGELALMEDAPRKATVTAISDVVTCWTVDRESFLHLFGSFKEAEDENVGVAMLKEVKILETLTDKQLLTLSRCLVHCNFKEGDVIIKQGDVGEHFYLIASGEVAVQVNHIQVATLTGGAFFGEMALLSNERRSATVTAKSDCVCLVLSRDDFDAHLGSSLEKILQAESKKRQQQQQRAGGGQLLEMLRRASLFSDGPSGQSSPLRPTAKDFFCEAKYPSPLSKSSEKVDRRSDNEYFLSTKEMFSLPQLHRLKKLGSGTFSDVFLVQHTLTSKFYALKVLNKKDVALKRQEECLFSERDLMLLFLDCDFVASLYATLQDEKNLYFVQQFIPGGDLFSLLHSPRLSSSKLGGLSPSQTYFYLANAIVILEYLHDQEVVHRDLKPENLVLDAKGYLRLVDFGSAKLLPVGCKASTLCGCALYLAPEVILSKGYNKSVDFWSLGVLLFELLTRKTPFAHDNIAMIYQNIVQSEENMQCIFSGSTFGTFDANSKSLLSALLTSSPHMRLGMLRDGIDEIWMHPALKNYSSDTINKRSIGAPFVPPSLDSVQLVDDCELGGLLDSINTEFTLSPDCPAGSEGFDFTGF